MPWKSLVHLLVSHLFGLPVRLQVSRAVAGISCGCGYLVRLRVSRAVAGISGGCRYLVLSRGSCGGQRGLMNVFAVGFTHDAWVVSG
jgi:purine-cytosine permease-like protein